MKVGIRKPSIKKSISARTTGKVKRKLKRMTNPLYGKKGMGFVKNPRKAIKGKIYRKTTVSAKNAAKDLGGCLWACCILPFYLMWYMLVLMWYMMKYLALGAIWLFVFVINGCIAFVEWCINLGKQDYSNTADEEVLVSVDGADYSSCASTEMNSTGE